MEVIFIGTGPSIPPPGRGNTAFVVRSAHSAFLVECGPTLLSGAQTLGVELPMIPHLFISHAHGDHMLGFPMLVLARMVTSKTMRIPQLNVFCPDSMVDMLHRVSVDVFPEVKAALEAIQWHPLPEQETSTFELEPDMRLTAMPMNGPPWAPTLGLRLDFKEGLALSYSSDTGPCEEVHQLAHGCDMLIHEAYFSIRLGSRVPEFFHSSASAAATNARRAGCRMLALIHMGPLSYGNEDVWVREAGENFFGEIIAPADGDIVRLNHSDIQVVKHKNNLWGSPP